MRKYSYYPNTPLNWIPSKAGSNSCENVLDKKHIKQVYNYAKEYIVFWMSTKIMTIHILSMILSSRSNGGTIEVDFEDLWYIWMII